jgi:hypothetical protein
MVQPFALRHIKRRYGVCQPDAHALSAGPHSRRPRPVRRATDVPARSFRSAQSRARIRSADGWVIELSGEVIESPHGLHSNAYKFPAKARLMICKAIGRPQTGQATSLLSVKSLLMLYYERDGGLGP